MVHEEPERVRGRGGGGQVEGVPFWDCGGGVEGRVHHLGLVWGGRFAVVGEGFGGEHGGGVVVGEDVLARWVGGEEGELVVGDGHHGAGEGG